MTLPILKLPHMKCDPGCGAENPNHGQNNTPKEKRHEQR